MAVITAGEGTVRSQAAAEGLLMEVVREHADELLRVARQHSLCHDDAHDAYQRSLEAFLRHGRRLRPETAHLWLFTVCKREAGAVRRAREELVGLDELDFARVENRSDASPEEQAIAAEAVGRSAEALRGLKAHEVRALWLKADGASYAEIQELTGWSYTKVNRSLRDGRKRFLRRCAELESGRGCVRWRGALVALAAGEAGAAELTALRPHLRACTACRATLRGMRLSGSSLATVLPPGVLLGAAPGDPGGWLARTFGAVLGPLQERTAAMAAPVHERLAVLAAPVQERAAAGVTQWQGAAEVATSGKLAAVAASTVALAGGGAVAVHVEPAPPPRPRVASAPERARPAFGQVRSPAAPAAPAPVTPTAPAATVTATPSPPSADESAAGDAVQRPGEVTATDAGGVPTPSAAASAEFGPAPAPARRFDEPSPAGSGGTSAPTEFGAPAPAPAAPKAAVSTEFVPGPARPRAARAPITSAGEFGP